MTPRPAWTPRPASPRPLKSLPFHASVHRPPSWCQSPRRNPRPSSRFSHANASRACPRLPPRPRRPPPPWQPSRSQPPRTPTRIPLPLVRDGTLTTSRCHRYQLSRPMTVTAMVDTRRWERGECSSFDWFFLPGAFSAACVIPPWRSAEREAKCGQRADHRVFCLLAAGHVVNLSFEFFARRSRSHDNCVQLIVLA